MKRQEGTGRYVFAARANGKIICDSMDCYNKFYRYLVDEYAERFTQRPKRSNLEFLGSFH